jgi:hypothetical protein
VTSRGVGLLLAIVVPCGVAAQGSESVQIHGFAQLNPILTTANNFFGQSRDSVSLEFWEVGINGSWRPTNDLLLSGQLTSRRAGAEDDGSIRVDYALLSYTLIDEPKGRAGFRVGRVLNPLGFFNETRDVAFTRSSILLPQSIYFDRTRDLALSGDGLQLFANRTLGSGDLAFQLNWGLPVTDDDERSERSLLGFDFPGKLEGRPSIFGRLIYEYGGGRLRFGVSGGSVRVDYEPGSSLDPLPKGEFDFQPLIFSAQLNAEKFSLTSEFGPRVFHSKGFGRRNTTTTTGESGYLEGLYRFTPKWEAFIRYDTLFADRDDRYGNEFAARDVFSRPAHSRFAKDLGVGVTWRINNSVLLRGEYHYVDGTAWLPIADNPNYTEWDRYWSIFGFQIAVRF